MLSHFRVLQDPHIGRTRGHALADIVVVAPCGFLCGYTTWTDIVGWAEVDESWLETFLGLPNGVPSHDTFGRVFARLDPDQLEACVRGRLGAVAARLGVARVATDGTTLRGSADKAGDRKALHLVPAWATDLGLTLGRRAVGGKSNEIVAIPELLEVLNLKGRLASMDAMGCQAEVAAAVRSRDADCLLQVKGNQPTLRAEVERLAAAVESGASEANASATADRGHGRVEERWCYVLDAPADLGGAGRWPGVRTVVVSASSRKAGGTTGCETRCFIGSRAGSASSFAAAIRGHWGVEDQCHWSLDITWDEDGCRNRVGHGPANMGVLRRLASSILKRTNGPEKTIKGRAPKAALHEPTREKIH